jgi:putative ABC transport system permease protein
VVISNFIALPFAYYLSNYILDVGWIYRTDLNITLFLISSLVSIFAAALAVGVQSLKAALADPVKSLRYE